MATFKTIGDALEAAYDAAQVQQSTTYRVAHARGSDGCIVGAILFRIDPKAPGVKLTADGKRAHVVESFNVSVPVPIKALREAGHGDLLIAGKYILADVSEARRKAMQTGADEPVKADGPADDSL